MSDRLAVVTCVLMYLSSNRTTGSIVHQKTVDATMEYAWLQPPHKISAMTKYAQNISKELIIYWRQVKATPIVSGTMIGSMYGVTECEHIIVIK